ncbi:hypothetical protein K0M31_017152 [Melipona bicolor]|uniref:Uncharacterized protein n=1 Tax=Melipona bicolor TaxID=60889 RepID=A0AA40KE68_9HYME|nr:hypothetical protein K0M31_017152 [Melipona bicolor]
MKSIVALTLALFCLSMLVDFGACASPKKSQKPHKTVGDSDAEFSPNFAVMAAEVLNALDVFAEAAVTADALAKFMIDVLNAVINAGLAQ